MSGLKVAVIGATGGIGSALVRALCARDDVAVIHATRRRETPESPALSLSPAPCGSTSHAATTPLGTAGVSAANIDEPVDASPEQGTAKVNWRTLDVTDEDAIGNWLSEVKALDWLINCVGMLHESGSGPEKTIRHVDAEHFQRSMQINCLPTLLFARHALAVLRSSPVGVFATISARVGSIQDNRLGGWYSYRCSKAALNMALKCLSIEWGRTAKQLRVVALHPGTTDTALSEPFQSNVPAGKLFTPEKTASLLLTQLMKLPDHPSGRFIAYDGEEIPW